MLGDCGPRLAHSSRRRLTAVRQGPSIVKTDDPIVQWPRNMHEESVAQRVQPSTADPVPSEDTSNTRRRVAWHPCSLPRVQGREDVGRPIGLPSLDNAVQVGTPKMRCKYAATRKAWHPSRASTLCAWSFTSTDLYSNVVSFRSNEVKILTNCSSFRSNEVKILTNCTII